jgi:Na+-driven multidrug efflux pump
MSLVSQGLGASRPDQAARSGWTAFGLGCATMSLMGLIFYTLAPWMFRLYCPDPSQAQIVQEGTQVLRLIAFVMPALASSIIFTAALRGAGDTIVPVVFSWIGFLGVRIPLAYYLTMSTVDLGPLGEVHGLFGAWLAMCADIMVRGGFFLWRFASGRWKRMRV